MTITTRRAAQWKQQPPHLATSNPSPITTMDTPLLTIPNEILFEIANLLPRKCLIALLKTCRAMQQPLHAFLLSRFKNQILLFAAKKTRLDLLRIALSAGADVSYDGQTEPNSEPDVIWRGKDTALHYATYSGDTAIIAELLRYNPPLEHVGSCTRTPLLSATYAGHEAAVDMLLAAGSDPEARDGNGKTLLSLAIQLDLTRTAEAHIHQMDEDTLDEAVEERQLSIVKLMFANGIGDVVVPPLQLAVYSGLSYVKLCIEHGEPEDIDDVNEDGVTALALAAECGYMHIVVYLLAQGADVNAGPLLKRPIMRAVAGGYIHIFKLLLQHGADLTVLRTEEVDILWKACSTGEVEIVEILLDALDGWVPTDKYLVWVAASNRLPGVVRLLVERGIDVDGRGELSSGTALHRAAGFKHRVMVEALLECGADIELLDDQTKVVVRKFICQQITAARKLKRDNARKDPRWRGPTR